MINLSYQVTAPSHKQLTSIHQMILNVVFLAPILEASRFPPLTTRTKELPLGSKTSNRFLRALVNVLEYQSNIVDPSPLLKRATVR